MVATNTTRAATNHPREAAKVPSRRAQEGTELIEAPTCREELVVDFSTDLGNVDLFQQAGLHDRDGIGRSTVYKLECDVAAGAHIRDGRHNYDPPATGTTCR